MQILIMGYAGVGFVSILGYWPTIKDLYRHKKQSANSMSYSIWTATATVVLLYSVFVSSDILFRFIATTNFICSMIVLLLSINFSKQVL